MVRDMGFGARKSWVCVHILSLTSRVLIKSPNFSELVSASGKWEQ